MSMSGALRSFPTLVLIHRRHVWVSELVTYIFVSCVAGGLAAACALIALNESTIARQHRMLAELKAGKIALTATLQAMREKDEVAIALVAFTNGKLPISTLADVVDLVCDHSRTFGYDPFMVLAVINAESVFNPAALGRYRSKELSGALGLMQLKFETAQEVAADLGIVVSASEELLRPEINIPVGIAYLTRLIGQFRSFKLGLVAYNLGPGVVYQHLSQNIPLPVTYYRKVLKSYFRLKAHAQGETPG